jgi:hypothetical protein
VCGWGCARAELPGLLVILTDFERALTSRSGWPPATPGLAWHHRRHEPHPPVRYTTHTVQCVCVCVGMLAWRTIDDDTSHAESQRHCQNSSLFFSPKVQPRPAEVRRTNKYDRAKKPGFWAAASYMTVHCYSLYIYIYIYIYIYMINFILIKLKIYVFYLLVMCTYKANNQVLNIHLYIYIYI